ncbi:DUF2294 domain-containing protein [Bacillus sp. A301a_S52]|jgi:uncharacterized protein YbcI|uniref:DUF2294 domain-containing protein n=1 Tax=Salipaludibacillus agaradhaerens TaxID=76935 RepID=UPI0009967A08|nr:DUF2294 domain-containing protein [Salipaludibacillus agaradhaerens]MCR6109485.1 DUF2294 domain-containing protein [Bacillus sp. A301a_S52]
MTKSKGSIEAEISKVLTQWEKDYLGRGSVSVKTDILRDMIIVSLKGVLTPAEYTLCKTKEGKSMIKKTRSDLVETGVDILRDYIYSITGQKVISFHTDLSTMTGERIIVFKLASDLEETFRSTK